VTQRWLAGAVVLVVACGGGGAGKGPKVTPTLSGEQAVDLFMKAVSDSNLAKMATLWGSAKGSASSTGQPADFERRMVVIQAYLKDTGWRILGADLNQAETDRRTLQVELKRDRCTKVVPFSTVKTANGGWVVNTIDLAAAGTPGRACDEQTGGSP
jgi:hypothetical protein